MALEAARLLAKHHALSQTAAHGVLSGLAIELLGTAHDPAQLLQAWVLLEPAEQTMPDVAIVAAQRLLELGGSAAVGRQWLLPVWDKMLDQPSGLGQHQCVNLVRALEAGFASGAAAPVDNDWLTRIESAQLSHPGDAVLQYLAGVTCMRLQLWGKARQLLQQSLLRLQDTGLRREAWRQLAELALVHDDAQGASDAWRKAAEV